MLKTITIDCPPQALRPDDILKKITLNIIDFNLFKVTSKFFGEWIFEIEVDKNLWDGIQGLLYLNLVHEYHSGNIRYGAVDK